MQLIIKQTELRQLELGRAYICFYLHKTTSDAQQNIETIKHIIKKLKNKQMFIVQ